MRELDPADLVRALNGDDPREDERSQGTRTKDLPTIGVLEDCWCGRPKGHDWLGKEDKAPHPRYPE